jgi:hypothetical protein
LFVCLEIRGQMLPFFVKKKTKTLFYVYTLMKILKAIGTAQIIKFIPTRSGVPNELFLRNESTDVETNQYIDCTTESFYSKFSEIVTLEEGHFYSLTINENSDKYAIDNLVSRVVAEGGVFEAESCLYTFLALFEHTSRLVHRDKVFVTNQDIDTYSVNNNEYVNRSENIILYE